jgi:hypothetical protein
MLLKGTFKQGGHLMFKVEFDIEKLKSIIDAAVSKAMEQYAPLPPISNQLPLLMTKKQLMELLDIGATKATELLNRTDFPVIREFGHPRVPTRLFLEWVESHTDWINENAGSEWNRRRGA